jgi:hypothetical protein
MYPKQVFRAIAGEKSIAKHLYLQWHYGNTNFTDESFIELEILG